MRAGRSTASHNTATEQQHLRTREVQLLQGEGCSCVSVSRAWNWATGTTSITNVEGAQHKTMNLSCFSACITTCVLLPRVGLIFHRTVNVWAEYKPDNMISKWKPTQFLHSRDFKIHFNSLIDIIHIMSYLCSCTTVRKSDASHEMAYRHTVYTEKMQQNFKWQSTKCAWQCAQNKSCHQVLQ
jgi:hypothetical protein